MSKQNIERLLDIAKRLDEMADDGPSELTTLSDEIGQIAAALEDAPKKTEPTYRGRDMPRWIADLIEVVERAAPEVIAERYGRPDQPSINIANPYYYQRQSQLDSMRFAMSAGLMNPQDAFKGIANII